MARKNHSRAHKNKKTSVLWPVTGGVLLLVAVIAWRAWHSTSSAAATPSGVVGGQVGDTAPDFSVPTLDGGEFTLSEQRGRPTVIFFMAYWCGTCIPESQALARLQNEYNDRLQIIAIDVDLSSTPDALTQFKRAAGNGDHYWAFDSAQTVSQTYQVRSLDTTLILDGNGTVVYRDEFPTTYQTLKKALQEIGL